MGRDGYKVLKKGDKVVMHTCLEASKYKGKVWICENDEVVKGEGCYKQGLVFLKGFSSSFNTKYLQKVNIKDFQTEEIKKLKEKNEPKPIEEWGEDYGDCLWWSFPIEEPPYCGTPLDCNFPNYVTHFTRLILPIELEG